MPTKQPAPEYALLSDPAYDAFDVTPDDATDLSLAARGIYLGVGGDVKATLAGGSTVTFNNLVGGQIHGIHCKRIWATGTTATNIIGVV